MTRRIAALALSSALLALSARAEPQAPPPSPRKVAEREVADVERAFAASFAARDRTAFRAFLSPEAVFFSGSVARGPEAVMQAWEGEFVGATAPFSWRPEQVEALDGADLALSTGPVLDPAGKPIAVYNSIWRKETLPGGKKRWRIIFDKGSPLPAQKR